MYWIKRLANSRHGPKTYIQPSNLIWKTEENPTNRTGPMYIGFGLNPGFSSLNFLKNKIKNLAARKFFKKFWKEKNKFWKQKLMIFIEIFSVSAKKPMCWVQFDWMGFVQTFRIKLRIVYRFLGREWILPVKWF